MAEGRADTHDGTSVSIVTACLNSVLHMREAMESVLAQAYRNIEYVVIDGGSDDGTLDLIREFESAFGGRLRWVSEPDSGIYDAMNKGIALSTGDIVGILNSDDCYVPDAVARIVAAFDAAPAAGAVYGDAEIIDEVGRLVRIEPARPLGRGETRPDWLPMCHQSLFVRRSTYDDIGLYDTEYRVLADYEFVLRCLAHDLQFVHIGGPIARFRLGGVCNTDLATSTRERERIRVAYGANPVLERLRRIRHDANRSVYRVLQRGLRSARRSAS